MCLEDTAVSKNKEIKKKKRVGHLYAFAITWILLSLVFPMYKTAGLIATSALSLIVALIVVLINGAKDRKEAKKLAEAMERERLREELYKKQEEMATKKSYGTETDAILAESNKAMREMARLYTSIKDESIRSKINELMRITDKITQDAKIDPSDIPQIKKFMNYYLPTTIKLLNSYDRMSSQGIEGNNLNKSMDSINVMLDEAIAAYKKRLDELFENQALDIETDIHVLNTMLAREGLSGKKDFNIELPK